MRLKIKKLSLGAGRPVAFIDDKVAKKLRVHAGERIELVFDGRKEVSIVDVVQGLLRTDEISISDEFMEDANLKPGDYVEASLSLPPKSTAHIAKKLAGHSLSREEIFAIVSDISNNSLTEAEVAYFVSGNYEHGMSFEETIYLTEAMWKTGKTLHWHSPEIVDKHSIGGIAGNRTTPIVVSICASLGIIMPKTSSRAITSASGTADVIETIAKVDFSSSELKRVVKKAGACLAWGGALGLSPADDKLIRVERLLNLDPESQLLASIISKKLAAGSKYVLIDIPYGKNAKVSLDEAKKLKEKFIKICKHFKLKVKVVLTPGTEPIGNGIGPVLEMKDVLRVLKRDSPHPEDLEKKSLFLAGEILELVGRAKKGRGEKMAREALYSGKAYKKFNQIINAQGRKPGELKLGRYSRQIKSSVSGKVKEVNNKMANHLGRILGCPIDESSGIYLYKHTNDKVSKNDTLMTLYAESQKKLEEALSYCKENKIFTIQE
jgi:putative thymidine phosphorylase